jgi:PST family polysaccharide transporter
MVGTWTGVGTTLLTVLLAARGWGPYSLAVAAVAGLAAQALALWHLSHPRLRWEFDVRRWPKLAREAAFLQGVAATAVAMSQADNGAIAVFHPARVLGLYAFAYGFALRPLQLLAINLSSVIFPALTRLQEDPVRQTRAFLRAARVLAFVSIPFCLAQATVAPPAIRLLFNRSWAGSTDLAAILSVGMAFLCLGGPACALLQARRQFGYYFGWTLICAVTFVAAVFVGAWAGGALSVSVAVLIWSVAFGPLGTYVAVREGGGRPGEVIALYARPLLYGLVCFGGAAAVLASAAPSTAAGNAVRIAVTLSVGGAAYLGAAYLFMQPEWNEVVHLLGALIRRRTTAAGRAM